MISEYSCLSKGMHITLVFKNSASHCNQLAMDQAWRLFVMNPLVGDTSDFIFDLCLSILILMYVSTATDTQCLLLII